MNAPGLQLAAAADQVGGVTPFRFEKHEVRVVTDENGEPLFVGKDICDALEYANHNKAMGDHCKGVTKRYPLRTAGGIQEMRVLTEPDVLRLIVNCALPAAQEFERMVFEDILPTIRRTGSYSVAHKHADPLASLPPEQRALIGLMVDNAAIKAEQTKQAASIAAIEQRVEEAAQTHLMLARPANSEAIGHIRERINKKYGLPTRIIDQVIRQSSYAPKPAGMVKNAHENAMGGSYAVYWTKDVNSVFTRFVNECQRETATQATHPLIDGRFKLIRP